MKALSEEIRRRAKDFVHRPCDTVYLGGGTPSSLSEKQLTVLLREIRANFSITSDAEITMEMNPSDMSESYLEHALSLGINRLSIGVQSRDDQLLRYIGRRHTGKEAERAVRRAYRIGFHNISIDLMYELPHQSPADFRKSLLWAVHLPIQHISVYSLILEEGTRFSQLAAGGLLARPTEEESWRMYQDMCRILPHYGLERYEISSFARKGYRSKHNQKYWNLSDYLGMGPGASSRIGHTRFTDVPGVHQYERELLLGNWPKTETEELSPQDEREEYCFLALRRKEGINLLDFQKRYGKEIFFWYGGKIDFLKKKKLLKEENGRLFLTYRGAALGNYVFEQFIPD